MPLNLAGLETPITLRTAVPLTDEELMRFSEESKPYRVERNKTGEITIMTPVGGIGGTHEKYVLGVLFNWCEATGTGIDFSSNTGFNLPDGSCLSPDASWVSFARWNALTSDQQAGFPPLCPEFIIEVRSRSDSRRAVEAKMQLWMDNGAQLAWLIDPVDGNAVVYRPGAAPEALERPAVLHGEGPVQGFELPCQRLWQNR